MAKITPIKSPTEIPGGQNYVLVMTGDENCLSRHSRGVTVVVSRHTPAHMKEMETANALAMARDIAAKENLNRIYIVEGR